MVASILQTLRPVVDKTIASLAEKKFKFDPIVDKKISRISSLVGSSQKRHGYIIERAIIEAVKTLPNFTVWSEPEFKISHRVNGMISSINNVKKEPDWLDLLDNHFVYGESARTQQVDLIAYNRDTKKIIALEIKRGYGDHDAGKKKKILQEILATRLLLKSYGKQQGCSSISSEAYICSYYGSDEFDKRISISKDQLNHVFDGDVYSLVEEVNHYFRKKIREMAEVWFNSD